MQPLAGKVALVTGASRGVGKGIALSLAAAGAVVYITGRSTDANSKTVSVSGTITETAAEIVQRGGRGVAIQCDHRDDAQVAAVFKQIQAEQGRLDILVNNAWMGYEGYHNRTYKTPKHPFWKKPLAYRDENLEGVRWLYAASYFAALMMVEQKSGLMVNISFGVAVDGNAAYNVAKIATDRFTQEFALQLKKYRVAVVALYPGLVRTEGVLKNAKYFDMTQSESPEFTGRAVVALANDTRLMKKTGQIFVVAKLAQVYDFDDIDGTRPLPVE